MVFDITEAALTAVENTFEQMGFLFVAPASPEEIDAEGPTATAQVTFDGPVSGCVRLTVPEAILPELAANMLGQDQVSEAPLHRDALGEMANVICGNVVPAIGGPDAIFRLGRPVPAAAGDPDGQCLARLSLLLDGHAATLEVWTEGTS